MGLLSGISEGPHLREIILRLHELEFDSRKIFVEAIAGLLKFKSIDPNPLVKYLLEMKDKYIEYTMTNYPSKDLSGCIGILLRALLDKPQLHEILLDFTIIKRFVEYVLGETFDVASDSMDTLNGVLTYSSNSEDSIAISFVAKNYKEILNLLMEMIKSTNFFAKKEALKLLNNLLRKEPLALMLADFASSVVILLLPKIILNL